MQMSLFIVGIMVGGFAFGNLARLAVPGDHRLTWSETTLVGIAGAAVGAFVGNLVRPETAWTEFRWGTLLGVFAGTLIVFGAVNFVINRFDLRPRRDERHTTVELIERGESQEVEFKQSGRWNVHTEQRDPRIELAIAKTVAGFLNADGGTLLIGVSDEGVAVGLEDDLRLMKSADADRYALWITDHLERCLGKPAVAHVNVAFESILGHTVCRVDASASPSPVFLDEPGGNREADMYVRMGNSTRKLLTDEAMDYAKHRW